MFTALVGLVVLMYLRLASVLPYGQVSQQAALAVDPPFLYRFLLPWTLGQLLPSAWLDTVGLRTVVTTVSELSLLGNAKEHGQAALNLHQGIHIDAPEGGPHLVSFHGHGLVHHHLRWLVQAIGGIWQDRDAQQGCSHQRTGDRQHGHCGVLVELVCLNHQGGPWFAKVSLHGDGDEVSPLHSVQPSTSAKASAMNCCMSASPLSACDTRRD